MKIKTRFCPSPTGLMHLGNTRTALFNALLAMKTRGTFLMRMEDTDKVRSEQSYAEILLEDMIWLGLNWQEGPFWQSKRQDIYEKFYNELREKGLAYPCFCSEQQLALNRKVQRSAGKPPRYPGTCCSLTKEEINKKIEQELKPTLRFKVPNDHEIIFHDLVYGEQHFNSNDIGDFIIRRADGTSSFMFCNAIDDALMEVTHALRGADHLTNTPRQLMILRALNLPEPQYGHIPLIMGSDGAPLSKRNGSRSLRELRDMGFLPIALLNYLARLGHYYENDNLMNLSELAKNFSEKSFGHSPSKFDIDYLLHWQKLAITKLDRKDFRTWMSDETKKIVPNEKLDSFIDLVHPNVTFPEDLEKWAKVLFTELDYNDEQKSIIKDAGPLFFETAIISLDKYGVNCRSFFNAISENLSIRGKALYSPIRIALTGKRHGPELACIFDLLGIDIVKSRLKKARSIFK